MQAVQELLGETRCFANATEDIEAVQRTTMRLEAAGYLSGADR